MTPEKTWRSRAVVHATPQQVIETLTDTEACARWSPISFHLDDLDGTHLRPDTTTRLSGRFVGLQIRFELAILAANPARLLLRATGPIEIGVDYNIQPAAAGCAIDAAVSIRALDRRFGRLLARATELLLDNGTLDQTLRRIAHEAEQAARAPRAQRRRAGQLPSAQCA
jgi:hypothetical protein